MSDNFAEVSISRTENFKPLGAIKLLLQTTLADEV